MNKFKELLKLFFAFFRIGAFTFGGGYAMLPMFEREIVEKYKWATMEELMDYFAIGQCTPGVIAVNTATFVGHKNYGTIGGIVATLGVITPSVIIISLIASVLSVVYDNPVAKHAFKGVGVAVSAILVQAVLKIGKSGVFDWFTIIIAAAAFVISMFFDVSTIIIVVLAGAAAILYKSALQRMSKNEGEDGQK
ncbi:MAG: chromate transporter [Clostridia bacterium]|nr:chromate transporter [Clostridia bacterium]